MHFVFTEVPGDTASGSSSLCLCPVVPVWQLSSADNSCLLIPHKSSLKTNKEIISTWQLTVGQKHRLALCEAMSADMSVNAKHINSAEGLSLKDDALQAFASNKTLFPVNMLDPIGEAFWLLTVMAITASMQPESGWIVFARSDFSRICLSMDHVVQN